MAETSEKTVTIKFNKGTAIAIAVVAVLAGLTAWSDVYVPALVNIARMYALVIIGLLVTLILVGCAGYQGTKKEGESYYARPAEGAYRNATLFGAAAVVAFVATVFVGMYGSYLADKRLAESATATSDMLGDTLDRAPYDLAVDRRTSDKGDLRGTINTTRYVADSGDFTNLVEGPGFFRSGGYAGIVEQSIMLDGSTTVNRCEFADAANDRLGGWFGRSLEREIAHLDRGLRITDTDAYGYCDGDVAMVVVPVKELEGFYPVIEVPAGVALYHGDTGKLELLDTVEAGELPGPVYPMSIAAAQREALGTWEAGFWSYVVGNAGYADATGEDGDPNGSNPSEFAVMVDDESAYLTHLTIRSKQVSTRIAAISEVSSGTVTAGELNPIVIHEIASEERRESNKTIVERVKADYADELATRFSAGMEVFEIIPTGGTTWSASLGSKRTVQFRMTIEADGSSCLLTPQGQKVRCVDSAGQSVGESVSEDDFDDSDGKDKGESPEFLTELSDEELAELQQEITRELLRRINSTTTE